MKVVTVTRISDISDVDLTKPSTEPIFTRDGAKLVTLKLSSPTLSDGITRAISILFEAIPDSGRTLYLFPGSMTMNTQECVYTMVVGVSGMADLDKVLLSIMSGPARVSEPPMVEVDDKDNVAVEVMEEDAEIVQEATEPNA